MQLVLPLSLAALFLGWILYRLLIRRDLRKNIVDVYFGLTVFGIWAIIYWIAVM